MSTTATNMGLSCTDKHEKIYMNSATGSVDTYDGWWYENESGEKVNAVDLGEVVEVVTCDGGNNYKEA